MGDDHPAEAQTSAAVAALQRCNGEAEQPLLSLMKCLGGHQLNRSKLLAMHKQGGRPQQQVTDQDNYQ